MGRTKKIYDALWAKHVELQNKSKSADRSIMSYLIYLQKLPVCEATQEQMEQLGKDSKTSVSPMTSTKDAPTDYKELKDLKDDAASIASAISSLTWTWHSHREANKRIFSNSLDILRRQMPHIGNSLEARRKVEIHVEVLRELNERNGFLSDIVIEYLVEYLLTPITAGSSTTSKMIELHEVSAKSSNWLPLFLVFLVCQKCCSPQRLLREVFEPILKQCLDDLQQTKPLRYLPCYANAILMTHMLLAVNDSEDIVEDCFLTVQDLNCLAAVREHDLAAQDSAKVCFNMLTLLAQINTATKSQPTQQNNDLRRFICEMTEKVLNVLTKGRSWLKRSWLFHKTSKKVYQTLICPWLTTEKQRLLEKAQAATSQPAKSIPDKKKRGPVAANTLEKRIDILCPTLEVYHRMYCWNSLKDCRYVPHDLNTFRESLVDIFSNVETLRLDLCEIRLLLLFEQVELGKQKQSKHGTSANLSPESDSKANPEDPYVETFVTFLFDRLLTNVKFCESILQLVKILPTDMASALLKGACVLIERLLPCEDDSQPLVAARASQPELTQALISDFEAMDAFVKLFVACVQIIEKARKTRQGGQNVKPKDDEQLNILIFAANRLLHQFRWFDANIKVFQVMEECQIEFTPAKLVLDSMSNNVTSAVDAVRHRKIAGVKEEHEKGVLLTMELLRASLFLPLRLLVPLTPTILSHPQACQLEAQPQLAIPDIFADRVNRIMPFQVHNVYCAQLQLATSQKATASLKGASPAYSVMNAYQSHFRPWEWLEDWHDYAAGQPPGNSGGATVVNVSSSTGLALLNNTPLSLAFFGACRLDGCADVTYKKLFKTGWRPASLTASSTTMLSAAVPVGSISDVQELNSAKRKSDSVSSDDFSAEGASKRSRLS
ncbi:hypothetical protein HK102_013149 [Quaeritorhiza haematococci]|nr:hypothetical protein HK102_013149 [Quaeritorhiza haematococci]